MAPPKHRQIIYKIADIVAGIHFLVAACLSWLLLWHLWDATSAFSWLVLISALWSSFKFIDDFFFKGEISEWISDGHPDVEWESEEIRDSVLKGMEGPPLELGDSVRITECTGEPWLIGQEGVIDATCGSGYRVSLPNRQVLCYRHELEKLIPDGQTKEETVPPSA